MLLYNALFLNRQVIVAPIIKNNLIKISRVKGKYIISKHEENRWSEFPAKIIKYIKQKNIQTFIFGNGSNLLVSDEGIKGIVLKIEIKKLEIEEINNKFKIKVGAGVKLGELAQKLANKGISGFEFASGIPGTIGGAIRMNAGAHGSEMKDIVKTVTYIDRNGEIHKINNEQAKFEYRNSMFANNEYIIVETELELNKGNKEEIQAKMQEYA